MRLTDRDLRAVLEALNRSLASEPETDQEDTEGQRRVAQKLRDELARRGCRYE